MTPSYGSQNPRPAYYHQFFNSVLDSTFSPMTDISNPPQHAIGQLNKIWKAMPVQEVVYTKDQIHLKAIPSLKWHSKNQIFFRNSPFPAYTFGIRFHTNPLFL